jgi:hypothetical protein
MNDIVVTRTTGGLGRREPSSDMICGVMTTGVAVSGGLTLGTVYTLKSLNDADALGVDADYDTTNTTLLYHHIKEFFRMNPSGELRLLVVARTNTLTNLADKDVSTNAKKLLTQSEGKINVLAIIRNPSIGYTPTLSNGFDADVVTAIVKAQALAEEETAEHRPVFILMEGRSYNGSTSSAIDLRGAECDRVAVTIASDHAVSSSNTLYNGYAAVGTILGCISKAKVNESLSWVGKFNIESAAESAFLTPGLSSNNLLTSYTATDFETLNTKGFIFPRKYTGLSGVYINDSHACTEVSSDYAYLENTRTIDKAIRNIRTALLPELGRPILVDKDTGKLSPEVAKRFETLGLKAVENMGKDGEVSGFGVFVDPSQDILSTSQLQVKFECTPTGTARTIAVTIGFNNPF